MNKISKSLAAMLILGGVAIIGVPAASAQEAGFYAGLGVGQSKFKDACEGVVGAFACDDKDTAWKIFGGYQVNRYFGAEIGYVDLGKATLAGSGVAADYKATAWELVGVGTFPITGGLSAYGKAGVYRWDVDSSASILGLGAGRISDNGNDWTLGLGVRYDITRNIAARAEWQRYNNVGNSTVGETDVDLWSIGVMFKF